MRNYFSGACGGMEEYTIVWKYVRFIDVRNCSKEKVSPSAKPFLLREEAGLRPARDKLVKRCGTEKREDLLHYTN